MGMSVYIVSDNWQKAKKNMFLKIRISYYYTHISFPGCPSSDGIFNKSEKMIGVQ